MSSVDFAARREQAEKEGLLGSSDYLKIKEGTNRLRLLSECLPHPGEYKGKPNFKWLCYVLDRVDGKIKPYFMPHGIYKQIEALQLSDDYAFEAVPMPYDITINAKGAGTKEVEYTVVPARKNTELTGPELHLFEGMKPLHDLQQALRAKNEANRPAEPTTVPVPTSGGFDPDEIPF